MLSDECGQTSRAQLAMPSQPDQVPPRCNPCAHYYITHDMGFRYGCRALGFKSQRQPILDVLEASEQQCHFFQQKLNVYRKGSAIP